MRLPFRLIRAAPLLIVLSPSCARDDGRLEAPEHVRANGRVVAADSVHVVTTGGGGVPIGLANSGALCGSLLYLSDPRQALVHELDLSSGQRTGVFGGRGDGPGEFSSPEAVAVDCSASRLYVADSRGVSEFDTSTGQFLGRIPKPQDTAISRGRALVDSSFVYLPGLWLTDREGWRSQGARRALRGARLGYRQSLENGSATPLMELLDEDCRSVGIDCLGVSFDRIQPSRGWVACQALSHFAGVYDADGTIVRRVDVRSPMFASDGTSVSSGASTAERVAWLQRNSVIHGCFSFGEYLVVVHAAMEERKWTRGVALSPRVLANVYRLDGEAVVVDVGFRDYPLARNEHSIFVVAYGEARATNGGDRIEVEEIRVLTATGGLNGALIPEPVALAR